MKKTVLFVFAALLLLSLAAAAGDTADLECPDCARAEPLLEEAVKTYKIPLVRYDFPLPKHNWSFDAHVYARWFDTKSKEVGDAYRSYIFANQISVTRDNLRQMTEKFASDHKLALPLFVDPSGELAAKVRADFATGQRVGIQHTPTIYIVTDSTRSTPFVEVVNRDNLFQMLDDAKRQAGGTVTTGAPAATPKAKPKKTAQK